MKKLVFIALPLALSLGACADEEQSGGLTINYELGFNVATCEAAEVGQIRATLDDSIAETELCTPEGRVEINGVPARSYPNYVIEAIDAEGVTVLDSTGVGQNPPAITVPGNGTEIVNIVLTETPAQIQVSFNLLDENGFAYGGQQESPVTAFDVIALRGGGGMILHSHEFVVAQQPSLFGLIVPDEEKAIAGTLLDQVRINYTAGGGSMPVDVDGAATFSFDPPGRGRLVDILVECRADVCTGVLQGIMQGEVTTGDDTATGTGGADGTGTG